MMSFYYVKKDLFGVPKGTVERFHPSKAGPLVQDGSLEHFDPKNKTHASAPGSNAPGVPKLETDSKK